MSAIQREATNPSAHDDQQLGTRSLITLPILLATGGDGRIWPHPITRRNRYGTLTTPTGDEISFSSTTASNVSEECFLAAAVAMERLGNPDAPSPVALAQWFADLRDGIRSFLGASDAEVLLAASGTDVELLTISMFAALSARPLVNILVAPDETGSGVPLAASGCHYSDHTALGSAVRAGVHLEGISPGHIGVRQIAIRLPTGEPRREQDVDADLIAMVEEELEEGHDVVVHVLDTSKTGLSGVSRPAARYASSLAPERVHVVVDACQLRCPISSIRQDLADGFAVAVTGSKFIGGPPFSGALLIPKALVEKIAALTQLPVGLSDYTSAHDWPDAIRRQARLEFRSQLNLGLGLRWTAALANLSRYSEIDELRQFHIKSHFAELVRSRIEAASGVCLHPDDEGHHLASRAILPLTMMDHSGGFATFEHCQKIHALMREGLAPICHIGQAVRLGSRSVLRIAASATDVSGVSARMAAGRSLDEAIAPIASNLDLVFEKLSAVLHHLRAI